MNQKRSLHKRLYSLRVLLRDFWFFGWHRQLWYLLRFRNPSKPCRFVLIYCQGRTGSTFLSSALGQYDALVYEEEVMRRKLWHYQSFFTGLAKRNPSAWYVLKVKPMHLRDQAISPKDLFVWASQHETLLIHLTREDFFAHALSKIIASKREEYFKKVQTQKLEVDPQYLQEKMEELRGLYKDEAEDVAAFDALELVYEKDIKPSVSKKQTVLKVLRSLGIKKDYKAPSVQKVLSEQLKDEVLNWDEILHLEQKKPAPSKGEPTFLN